MVFFKTLEFSPKLMGLKPRPFRAALLLEFIAPILSIFGILAP